MATPAERRFIQARAQAAAAAAGPGQSLAGASAYELMLVKLDADRRRLKDIQSVERKIEVKREILPEYRDWVVGVLEGGKGAQDDVLTTIMVWLVDIGQYDAALDIGQYVLAHGLTLPDQYERDVPTALVDEISNAALAAQRSAAEFDTRVLERLQSLTAMNDMPDQARAKLHKALGLQYKTAGQFDDAVRELSRALELHPAAGCKRDLADAEKMLKEQEAEASN